MIDLQKYSSAFAAFEQANAVVLSLPVKVALVAVATNVDFGSNENLPAITEIFSRYDDQSTVRCLDDILRLETPAPRPERTLAATPTWNPPTPEEARAQRDSAGYLARRYSDAEVNARLAELQHRPEAVDPEAEVKAAQQREAKRESILAEQKKLQEQVEQLKPQAKDKKRKKEK